MTLRRAIIAADSDESAGALAYPLDDDGSLAAQFNIGHIPTAAPDFHRGTYTYTGTAGTAMALPRAENIFASQALPIADVMRGCQMRVVSVPASYTGIYLYCLFLINGTVATVSSIGLRHIAGDDPYVRLPAPADHTVRIAPAENYRVTTIVDGVDRRLWLVTSDGVRYFGPALNEAWTHVVFLLQTDDAGTPPAGATVTFELVPNAADMTAVFPEGVVDWNGQPCPVDAEWAWPEGDPPPAPAVSSVAVSADGTQIVADFYDEFDGSPLTGFSFEVSDVLREPSGVGSAPAQITWTFAAPILSTDVVRWSYDAGEGEINNDGTPLASFTDSFVTNNSTVTGGGGGEEEDTHAIWNADDKDAGLGLGGDLLTYMNTIEPWSAGRATVSIGGGLFQWQLTITALSPGEAFISLGVGTAAAALNDQVGADAEAFGLSSADGTYMHGGNSFPYCDPLVAGDVVTVLLDMDARELRFKINGGMPGAAIDISGLTSRVFPMIAHRQTSLFMSSSTTAGFGQEPLDYPELGYVHGVPVPVRNPANLNWSGADFSARLWWHINAVSNLSVNPDGSGGMPDTDTTAGALLNLDADNASTTNPMPLFPAYMTPYAVRRADCVDFPVGSLYLAYGPFARMATSGITIAFSGYSTSSFSFSDFAFILGRDNPVDGTYLQGSDNANVRLGGINVTEGGIDWLTEHRVVISRPAVGLTRVTLDGMLVFNSTLANIAWNWERVMNYLQNHQFNYTGILITDCAFSEALAMAGIDRFLEIGPE